MSKRKEEKKGRGGVEVGAAIRMEWVEEGPLLFDAAQKEKTIKVGFVIQKLTLKKG